MANRHTLSVTKLNEFTDYLISKGFSIEVPKGSYEALRATKKGRTHPLIVYRRNDNVAGTELVHLTVQGKDMPVVRNFINSKKGN